jgi:hypothetical protein
VVGCSWHRLRRLRTWPSAGITVSASVPIAVVSITLFVPSQGAGQPDHPREHGGADHRLRGESIAGGGFTLPPLVLLGFEMRAAAPLLLALVGDLAS